MDIRRRLHNSSLPPKFKKALNEALARGPLPKLKNGRQVAVFDGSGEKSLGNGHITRNVNVFVVGMPDGSIQSYADARKEPDMKDFPGGRMWHLVKNPQIKLDSGEIVYGCQVWWFPI